MLYKIGLATGVEYVRPRSGRANGEVARGPAGTDRINKTKDFSESLGIKFNSVDPL